MNKLSRTLLLLSVIPLVFSSCEMKKESGGAGNTVPAASESTGDRGYQKMRDISASELVKELKIGWCLGNTLESTIGRTDGAISDYETGWGNSATTEEMIKGVADAGFNVLRLPVSWGEHLSDDGNYTINEEWLNRVNEVVDYGIDNGLTVILNTHHESWLYPDYAHLEQNKEQLAKIWTQIGNRFEGYNEKLIFEGLNEPRKVNTPYEWNGGDDEGQDAVNQLNMTFIETIRSLGGNNPMRHLVIPAYAASPEPRALDALKLPENDDKIIVSVHAYLPYNFALANPGTAEWDENDPACTNAISDLMELLKVMFVDNGTPVIISEMGAVNRNNPEARAKWAEFYIRTAHQAGIPCMWWDNGAYLGNGELFGLYIRKSGKWIFSDVVDGMMRGLED